MAESVAVPASQRATSSSRRTLTQLLGGLALLAAVLLIGVVVRPQPTPASVAAPINPAIEAQWGVRVSQVAMTADGGLVDLRYVVLDATKAAGMLSDVANLPVVKAEDSGVLITSTAQMGDEHNLQAGRTYFLLYRNAGGAVKPGTPVTVIFPAGLAIEHVLAR
jgi:hypothetical protein